MWRHGSTECNTCACEFYSHDCKTDEIAEECTLVSLRCILDKWHNDSLGEFIGEGFFFFFVSAPNKVKCLVEDNESFCLESNPINKTEKGKEPDFEEHLILNISFASCRTEQRGDDDLKCSWRSLEIIPKLLFPMFSHVCPPRCMASTVYGMVNVETPLKFKRRS